MRIVAAMACTACLLIRRAHKSTHTAATSLVTLGVLFAVHAKHQLKLHVELGHAAGRLAISVQQRVAVPE